MKIFIYPQIRVDIKRVDDMRMFILFYFRECRGDTMCARSGSLVLGGRGAGGARGKGAAAAGAPGPRAVIHRRAAAPARLATRTCLARTADT